jgi:hypothetical protein
VGIKESICTERVDAELEEECTWGTSGAITKYTYLME